MLKQHKILMLIFLFLPINVFAESYTLLGDCAVQYMKKGYSGDEVHVTNLLTVDSMKIIQGAMALYRGTNVDTIPLKSVQEAKALMGSFATCLNKGEKVRLNL